jgi:hypothetical protein
MRSAVPTTLVMCGVLLAAACTAEPAATTTTMGPVTPSTTPSTVAPTTTPATSTTPSSDTVCLSGDLEFVASGSVARLGSGVGDAEQLASLRWAAHPGCERVVLDLLAAGGAPAGSLGDAAVALLADHGIVRVSLPRSVATTGIVDSRFDGELARRAFVVRLPDGSLAVDIHLAASVPVQARAFTVDAPVRVVVDLRPTPAGGPGVVAPPTVGDTVVVLSPPAGESMYPLVVSGYARTFEATVVGRLIVDGTVAAEGVATAADWIDAWGSFSISIADGPPGAVSLFVGEDSPRDGSPEGVTIPLVFIDP